MTIYTVFVEHTSSLRSFAKIATTDKQKAQKEFNQMCSYFFELALNEGNSSSYHWNNDTCVTFVDCVVIKSDKSKHIIHFDKFEED